MVLDALVEVGKDYIDLFVTTYPLYFKGFVISFIASIGVWIYENRI